MEAVNMYLLFHRTVKNLSNDINASIYVTKASSTRLSGTIQIEQIKPNKLKAKYMHPHLHCVSFFPFVDEVQ